MTPAATPDKIKVLMASIAAFEAEMALLEIKGGAGSGNWGHAGRPGKRGGSSSRGGGGQAMSRPPGAMVPETPKKKRATKPTPPPPPAPAGDQLDVARSIIKTETDRRNGALADAAAMLAKAAEKQYKHDHTILTGPVKGKLRTDIRNLRAKAILMQKEAWQRYGDATRPHRDALHAHYMAEAAELRKKIAAGDLDADDVRSKLVISTGTPNTLVKLGEGGYHPGVVSWMAGVNKFNSLVSQDLIPPKTEVTLKPTNDERATCEVGRAELNLPKSCGTKTIVHEMGHALEHINPVVKERVQWFLKNRTSGLRPQKLSDLTGNPNYDDHEIAIKDKFIDPYMGKTYATGDTEILAMGLEYMVDSPVKFATQDPATFDFIYATVRSG